MVGLRLVAAPRLLRLRDREVRRRVPWIERVVGEGLRAVLGIGREGRHPGVTPARATGRPWPAAPSSIFGSRRQRHTSARAKRSRGRPAAPRTIISHSRCTAAASGAAAAARGAFVGRDSIRRLAEGGALALDGLGLRRRGVGIAEQRRVRAP